MNSFSSISLDAVTQKNIDTWLKGDYDEETKNEIRRLLRDNPKEAVDAFYTSLAFGTGGLRGVMGVGTNRMNVYTVRAATQGLANYIKKNPPYKNQQSVLIGYDTRHHSREFAEEAAKVLAGNGIKVYLFKDIRPTPLVSFGCRELHCSAAIMVTASHNPAEYNGYKVYWNDGGQVVPPHDVGIIDEVNKITDLDHVHYVPSIDNPLIQELGEELDQKYLNVIAGFPLYPEIDEKHGMDLKIVYTSLHGVGITLVPQALARWGFKNISYVDSQIIPDGAFPTVRSPNPEEKEALQMGIDKMLSTKSDIFLATDPDADRVGVVVMHQGQPVILNGNQIACICIEHICEALTKQGKMPKNGAFVKSCVTSELFKAIAEHYRTTCLDVLPGFKYIAHQILEWEQNPNGKQFIFGAEESYGYLLGTHSRDKDAVEMCALLAEIALQNKQKNKTLIDFLNDIYQKYGVYYEKVHSIKFPETKEGRAKMQEGMVKMRKNPPSSIMGMKIKMVEDYLKDRKADILTFWMEDGSKLMVRPSGTEPKIKIYCGVRKEAKPSIEEAFKECEKHTDALLASVAKLF